MDDDGPAGAEAAAVYFLQLDDYIMKSGDTTTYKAMSHDDCARCTARLDQAQEIADRGDRWTGGDVRASILRTYEQDAATGIWPIDVSVRIDPVVVTDSDGEEVFTDKEAQTKSRIEIARQDDGWVVIGIGDIPET